MRRLLVILSLFLGCLFVGQQGSLCLAQSKTKTTQQKKTTTKKKTQTNTSKTSETLKDLKNKQSSVDKNVKKIDKSLAETRQSTRQSLKQLEQINSDIKRRNEQIETQGKEIMALDTRITEMNRNLGTMQNEYAYMKEKYVQLIYHAYVKQKAQDKLLFVLSAPSFHEAYMRFNYINKFATLRREQAEALERSRVELDIKKQEIESTKRQSEKLLRSQESEQKQLLVEKQKQNEMVASLKKQEKELVKELQDQQRISDQLNKRIQDLIAKQAQESATREKKKQATQPTTKGGYAMTQTEKVVSGGFEKKQGSLPWPVNGTVVGHFGKQQHPVLKHVTTDNKGIYISSPKGSEATLVHDGVVTTCFAVPGNNNAIIVRHGNFLTVYSNLTKVYVKTGDNLKSGHKLGKIYEDPDDKYKATLFFQIWKEKDLQNPERWLKKK
ncbi:MAG: peptidoglycan DD-metalloendopeptidase family protein [Paludibacteraceae bacterium]|nr:peptidoglycan DD-metalloendopeptidase family protein [Paludibacteraceae bacterium]